MEITNSLHVFYKDNYYGATDTLSEETDEEIELFNLVDDLIKVKVTYNGDTAELGSVWVLKKQRGAALGGYHNLQRVCQVTDNLNFAKIAFVPELQKENIGLRFIASLVSTELIVDVVRYQNNLTPTPHAILEKRYQGRRMDILNMAKIAKIIVYAQSLYESEDVISKLLIN